MLLYASLLALAGATNGANAIPATTGEPTAASQKKICKREIATGSVMPKRTCRTQAEWDALSAEGQNDLDRTRNMERSRSMVGGNRGS